MKKRSLRMAILLVLFLVPVLSGCQREERAHRAARTGDEPVPASRIRVAPVVEEEIPLVREFAGTVRARTVSRISARVMAQVLEVTRREGDLVKEGELLVRLDDRELKARVRQAESALGQARSRFDLATRTRARYEKLREEKAVSPQEYDTVVAQERTARQAVSQAESAVAEARAFLDFAEIRSPVSGLLVERRIDPGSMAVPGMPLLLVEPRGEYRVEAAVDMSVVQHLEVGSPLEVAVDAASLRLTVPVAEIVPQVDSGSRTVRVKADLPDRGREGMLRSGQYARVRVRIGSSRAVVVPESALVERGQLDGVFVVRPGTGRLRFRIVRVGRRLDDGRRVVVAGLSPSERIVVEGASLAADGVRVESEAAGEER